MHTHTYSKYFILYYRCTDEHSSLMFDSVKEEGGRERNRERRRVVCLAAEEPG